MKSHSISNSQTFSELYYRQDDLSVFTGTDVIPHWD